MSMKDLKKCEECGKNFTHNIGLKGHITAVHERKDSIVINVFMKKTLNSIVITVAKIIFEKTYSNSESHKTLD